MAVYQIHFHIEREMAAQVGRLGRFPFAPGSYFYTGCARRRLESRLRRHLARTKKRHWHIDALLGRAGVEVDFVVVCEEDAVGGECGLHQRALSALSASTPVGGFGSTDCRRGCPSHLGRLRQVLSKKAVLRHLGLEGAAPETCRIWQPPGAEDLPGKCRQNSKGRAKARAPKKCDG